MMRNPGKKPPSKRGEVLVVVVNNLPDWQIVREHRWYRIPIDKAPRRWPPKLLAFYQTKVFGEEAHAIHYVAKVQGIKEVQREDIFPEERHGPKSGRRYYQVILGPVEKLPEPIVSIRLRLIVFIPTTYYKLETAIEVNDLFDESPLEDAIWGELKKLRLQAERQYHIQIDRKWYALDFAIFCREGKIDVETDGDTWHADVDRIPEDNERNNALASKGWKVLRFNGIQVREQMREYCVPQIVKTVNQLGGLAEGTGRSYTLTDSGIQQQLHLFDED